MIMNAFEKILNMLEASMEVPTNYGAFHIVFLVLTVAASALLIWRFRNSSDKAVRRMLLVVWLVMVALEIYKQLVFSLTVTDGVASWGYQWYAFPFQFCSTPLYALPFIVFLKDGALRRSFIVFFAGFSFFAGLAVMLYPNDVYIDTIGINIQTMIHHGSQVAIGAFLVAYNRRHMNKRYFAGSLGVFCSFAAVAMLLNVIVHAMFVNRGIMDQTFNMFYISPYYDCILPVLSSVYKSVPYPVFLMVYLLGFAAVSARVFGIEKGILMLAMKSKKES